MTEWQVIRDILEIMFVGQVVYTLFIVAVIVIVARRMGKNDRATEV